MATSFQDGSVARSLKGTGSAKLIKSTPRRLVNNQPNAKHEPSDNKQVKSIVKSRRASPPLAPPPVSPETRLSSELGALISNLHLGTAWVAYTPSHIGNSPAVDSAARALTRAYKCRDGDDGMMVQRAYRDYVEALKALRSSIDVSDTSLMAMALLGTFESIMKNQLMAYFSHWSATTDAILSRPETHESSEFTRAILYASRDAAFRFPVALGIASPFDQERFLKLQPVSRLAGIAEETARLTQLSYQMFVRLPRLIALARNLRSGRIGPSAKRAVDLAKELFAIDDVDAENKVLHRVSVKKTVEPVDPKIVPYSFEYKSLEDHEAAMPHWESRLILLSLILKILPLLPAGGIKKAAESAFDREKLDAERLRMTTNIMMSFQYPLLHGRFAGLRLPQAIGICWGVLLDIKEYRGMPTTAVRSWLLDLAPLTYGGWPINLAAKDMEEFYDVFMGGPIKGVLIRRYMYGRPRCLEPAAGVS